MLRFVTKQELSVGAVQQARPLNLGYSVHWSTLSHRQHLGPLRMNEEWKEHSTPRQCGGWKCQVSLSIHCSLVHKSEILEVPDQGQWMGVQYNSCQE